MPAAAACLNAGLGRKDMATTFTVNGKAASTDAPPDTPLLWVIREGLKLTGTKFGCGAGLCGACMVHIDGKRAYSCQTQISEVAGKSEIGRASCREKSVDLGGRRIIKKKKK